MARLSPHPRITNVVVATMETENFTFMAAGQTKTLAHDAMTVTIRQHMAQYGAWHDKTPQDVMYAYDVRFNHLELNAPGLRDGSPIVAR